MPEDKSISRRKFLEKSTLVASATGVAAITKKARAQINNGVKAPPARVGVGFIGAGIRGTYLLEDSKPVAGFEPVVICDLYDGHLDRVKELCGESIATTKDYQEVLARSDVDAVVISAPDHWHKRMYLEALQAGKHVYIEKPMTHRWEDGEEFIKAEKKYKRVVQVGSQYVSMACVDKARDLISSGRLGQITMIEASVHRNSSTGAWYYPIPPDANPRTIDWKRFIGQSKWYDFDPKRFFQWRLFWDYSGGLPTDLYVHLVGAVHDLMGVEAPSKVVAFGDIYRWKNYRDVPDQIEAMAFYPDKGFNLKLTATANNSHPGPSITFYGTGGTMEYTGGSIKYYFEPRRENFRYPTFCWTRQTVKEFAEIMNLDEDLSPIINSPPSAENPLEIRSEGGEGATTAHLRNFYDAIRNGTKAVENAAFGHHAALVGHMANISYKTGEIAHFNKKTRKVEAG
ncbi:MAG: Gfo/Idh/MocA family oxidoreductase [Gemmatimonadota bacterium]|nr:Gfo/Idh/MocA family oxidoreductase [Gemmatimonadota bacterium]